MNKTLVLLASILIATTPLAGCIDGDTLEEIIDDVVGCMDTEAKNYDENATTELVGNCIYAASKEAFMDAMNQEIDLQSMLNQSTTAGYSMSMTAPMGDELGDMGDDMMVLIEETVMVNMSANAAHVSIAMSIPMLFSSITTMTQVGGVVNVHHKLDGMLVSEMGAETVDEKYQTRDMVPNVMDWVIPMLADSMANEMAGDSEDTEDDLIDDDWDMDSATISVSFDSETNSQTMDLSTAMDNGSTMNLSVKIDENSELMSYSMVVTDENGSSMHMSYALMWGDAVVITVDQTLPKTAIPVHWDGLPDFSNHDDWDDDDDGHDHDNDDHDNDGDSDNEPDMFVCDNGNEIPMDWVNDGMDDCGDNSDEYDDDNSDDNDDHDNGSDSDNEPDMFVCDNGNEIPMDWVNDGMDDCGDNSDEYDDDNSDDNDDHDNDGDSDNEPDMFVCDNGNEIPMDWVNDGMDDCGDNSDEYDDDNSDDGDGDDWNEEPRDLFLTVANNQTFEAPLSDFSIQFLSCHSDVRSDCNVEESSSLTELTGQMGDSNYVYVDVDADGMISAGDTLEITSMDPSYEFDLYDSWSDSYVSDSGVNGPNMPGFGGILATISMLAAAFLLPRRDD